MTIYVLRNNSGDVYDHKVINEVYCKSRQTLDVFVEYWKRMNELYLQLTGHKYADDLYSVVEVEVQE